MWWQTLVNLIYINAFVKEFMSHNVNKDVSGSLHYY